MATAVLGFATVSVLAVRGAASLAAADLAGLTDVGGGLVVAAVATLVVVRVADEGGPAGLARDRDATVVTGTVDAADGAQMREPVAAAECEAYLFAVEYDPPERPPETMVSGLVAAAPVTVDTGSDTTVLRLPPGREFTPSFLDPDAVAPTALAEAVVGDPDPFLRRLGVAESDAYSSVAFLGRERDRLTVVVEPLEPGDPVTVVGEFDGLDSGAVEPLAGAVVRRQSADAWAAASARGLRRARLAALVVGPVGLALVAAGLVLS